MSVACFSVSDAKSRGLTSTHQVTVSRVWRCDIKFRWQHAAVDIALGNFTPW
jgi:hypothetical protein